MLRSSIKNFRGGFNVRQLSGLRTIPKCTFNKPLTKPGNFSTTLFKPPPVINKINSLKPVTTSQIIANSVSNVKRNFSSSQNTPPKVRDEKVTENSQPVNNTIPDNKKSMLRAFALGMLCSFMTIGAALFVVLLIGHFGFDTILLLSFLVYIVLL